MKISYLTTYDASDIHNWSGLGFSIWKSLELLGHDMELIGNLNYDLSFYSKYKYKIYRKLNIIFDPYRELRNAKQISLKAQKLISVDTDIVFSPGTIPLAFLETNKPKVFYTDATFAGMVGYYDEISELCLETKYYANKLEQKALDNCDLAIYSSDWAAKTAIENYNVKPEKVKVVPFGANVYDLYDYSKISVAITNRSTTICNLLFIGVEWERKGGDTALKIAEDLNAKGIKTILHIVGLAELPIAPIPDYVINHGFVSKSTSKGQDYLRDLFLSSHFLVVPSRAEAYGLVFCEANAYGLPSIATDTGGISTIIKNDVNGKIFPIDSDISIWSNYIYDIYNKRSVYEELCKSSYNEYIARLNWNVAGKTITRLLKEI